MPKPIIKPLPTETDVKKWVRELVEPYHADTESKRLIQLLLAVANPDNPEQWELAMTAAREAYLLTTDFEENFHDFAGFPAWMQNRKAVQQIKAVANNLISEEEQ